MLSYGSIVPLLVVVKLLTLYGAGANADMPQQSALSIPVRTNWYGYDGFWSPVSIRVGTPPQWMDLLVSTASQETWVVGPGGGCYDSQQCVQSRGGIFFPNKSSTWVAQGSYALGLDPQLGFGDQGDYGLDSIALTDTISVPSQIIAVINSTDYLLGNFGLGVKPTNLTVSDEKTFLDSVVENSSLVPSHSYGYTAGAHYHLKGIPASLTLGGFDANRFRPHNVSFDLDLNQNPTVALNKITATASPLSFSNTSTGWKDNSVDLLVLSQADLFTIDSSTPFLWLPEAVCLQFEKALGLAYDENLQLYTFAKSPHQHTNLVNWNVSFVFTVADLPGSSKTVSLTLPYSAFDLQLSYPYPGLNITQYDSALNYFPLRKAVNSTQYTIGRSFLQETYLQVDYERNNFSISQAVFSVDPLNNMDLIDISRPKNSTWSGPKQDGGPVLSKAGIAGVVVAAVFGVAFLIGLLILFRKVRRNHPNDGYVQEKEETTVKSGNWKRNVLRWVFRLPKQDLPMEVGGTSRFEAPNDREIMELPCKESNSELDGSSDTEARGYYERDTKESIVEERPVNAIGHDPSVPVELPYRTSNYQDSGPEVLEPAALLPTQIHFSRPGLPKFATTHQPLARQGTQVSAVVSSPSDTESSKNNSPIHVVSPISPRDDSPEFSSLDTIARRAAWYVSNESPSVSSESRGGTERSHAGTLTIEERAGFPTNSSRQGPVSPEDPPHSPGTLSSQNTISPQDSPLSPVRVPRNSRATRNSGATAMDTVESVSSGEKSNATTVTDEIRQSVQRGFSWVPASNQAQESQTAPRTPAIAISEVSPYSPARWIEFWRTGRDPRTGPASDRNKSTGS